MGNCQNSIKFLSCSIFGHLSTGQMNRKHQNYVPYNVQVLQGSCFRLKNDDAIIINDLLTGLLGLHSYEALTFTHGPRKLGPYKKIGLGTDRVTRLVNRYY